MSVEKSKNVVITKKGREKLVKARAGAVSYTHLRAHETTI